jgi:hypothetical protein
MGKMGDTWWGVETSTKTGETDQGVTTLHFSTTKKYVVSRHHAKHTEQKYNERATRSIATTGRSGTTGERESTDLWGTRHKSREMARMHSPALSLVHGYEGLQTAVCAETTRFSIPFLRGT